MWPCTTRNVSGGCNAHSRIAEEFVFGEVFAEVKASFIGWSPHVVDLTNGLVVFDASFWNTTNTNTYSLQWSNSNMRCSIESHFKPVYTYDTIACLNAQICIATGPTQIPFHPTASATGRHLRTIHTIVENVYVWLVGPWRLCLKVKGAD